MTRRTYHLSSMDFWSRILLCLSLVVVLLRRSKLQPKTVPRIHTRVPKAKQNVSPDPNSGQKYVLHFSPQKIHNTLRLYLKLTKFLFSQRKDSQTRLFKIFSVVIPECLNGNRCSLKPIDASQGLWHQIQWPNFCDFPIDVAVFSKLLAET